MTDDLLRELRDTDPALYLVAAAIVEALRELQEELQRLRADLSAP